jgi:hypothetical protein
MNVPFVGIPSLKRKKKIPMKTDRSWLTKKKISDLHIFIMKFSRPWQHRDNEKSFTIQHEVSSPHDSTLSVLVVKLPAQEQRQDNRIYRTF